MSEELCPYNCHHEFDGRIRETEKKVVPIEDMNNKLKTLFEYHTETQQIILANSVTLAELRKDQHAWAGTLSGQMTGLRSDIQKLCADYSKVNTEVANFAWFRDPLNKLKEKFSWPVVLLLCIIAVAAFIVPFEIMSKALDIIKKMAGWFK